MLKNFLKLIAVASFYDKKKFYLVILSSFIIISLELFSVVAFIPLFQILISKDLPPFFPTFFTDLSYEIMLYSSLLFILSVFVLKNLLIFLLEWFTISYQEIIRKKLSSDIFKYFLFENWLTNIDINSTTKIRHIDGEVKNFSNLIFSLIKFANESVITFFLIIVLAVINFKILFFSFLILLIFGSLYLFLIRRKFIKLNLKRYKLNLGFLSILQDTFRSLKDIKVLQKEKKFLNKFDLINDFYKNVIIKVNIFSILPKYLLEPLIVFILVITVLVLYNSNFSDKDILITLGLFSVVLFRLYPATNKIVVNLQILTGGTPIIDIVFKDFERVRSHLIKDTKFDFNKLNFEKKIEVKNLNFKYKTKNKENLLTNINLELKKGHSIGIFGPSGSGKSTLINIILGLIQQDSGEIFVDSNKVSNLNPAWKRLIGYVPQDINLINDTLKNNITLNLDESFDEEKMQEAIKISKLSDFVKKIPKGINTDLGEFGNKISGGQKQRIGIARAIYRKPSIIVLDESTNSLDSNLEQEIIQSITEIKKNYSSIIISHRETTINRCDHIYELNKGGMKQIK